VAKLIKLIQYAISVLIFFLISSFSVFSQQDGSVEIKGKVLDEKTGEVLPGASVLLVNEKVGSVTDGNGNFSVRAKLLPTTLSVHFLGYKTAEIIVSEYSAAITVFLLEDTELLDEVVVVGYGTQRRKELTGSVASVSKSIIEHPSVSLDKMLGGAIAGVNVSQASGQPGAGSNIRIRGGNSVTASNEPLYVIDGFIFFNDNVSTKAGMNSIEGNLNPLAAINPSDIESVEILKDVSATAIYGSRGANGVIIVTTKKGKRENSSIAFQYSISCDVPSKKLDLLNATQWARMQKDFFYNKGRYTDEEIAALGEGYDWQNAVLKTGLMQTYELSLGGGDNQWRYLISGNYTDQTGIVLHSSFKRYNARVNFERNLTDRLTVGITSTVGKTTQNSLTTFEEVNWSSSPFSSGITNSLTYALYMPPVVPIYDADGNYYYHNPFEYGYLVYNGQTANPVSDLENSQAETIHSTLLGNFYAGYTILAGLTVKINAGTYIAYLTQNFFAPSYTALGLNEAGVGGIGNKKQEITQSEYTLAYTKRLNEKHLIDLLAGYTQQDTRINYVINTTSHFTNERLGVNNLGDGSQPSHPVSHSSETLLYSLIGRINYSFLERYNFTTTLRSDKSTRFAKNYRWAYFPSFGVSWNVNEESFYQRINKVLPSLKLRLTYGSVGNQEIGEYEYAQTFTAGIYNGQTVYTQTNLGNENLKWETTVQYNAGIDAGLFNNRLSLVADVYYKKTSDLLLEVPVDPSLSVKSQLFNVGNVTNQGFEAAVNWIPVENKKIKWTLSANFARNINLITNLGNRKQIVLGNNGEEILKVGESLGSFYGLKFTGIVQKDEDVSKLPTTVHGVLRPGDLKFADVSGADGKPDNKIDSNDRVVMGNVQPDFIYGFQTTVDYGNFDLFLSLQGSQGNKVYNSLRHYLESPNDSYNASAALLDSWTENNPSNTLPGLANLAQDRYYSYLDSRYIEDASFLRLRTLSIAYKVPLTKGFKGNIKIFASAQNLFTWTKYKGYDPEVARGIDMGNYPVAKSFSAGARVEF
jgi:TonB-linked SusC/RagA family outer membrane protein